MGRNFLCKSLSEFAIAVAASCEKVGVLAAESLQTPNDILKAFPEDLEMRAFTPLLQVQRDLDYTFVLEEQVRSSNTPDSASQQLRGFPTVLTFVEDDTPAKKSPSSRWPCTSSSCFVSKSLPPCASVKPHTQPPFVLEFQSATAD